MRLNLKCLSCGRTWFFELEHAFVSPDPQGASNEGWDGVLLSTIVRCPTCGAEDSYALAGDAQLVILGELVKATSGAESRVRIALCRIWDGTIVHRASHGLKRLRELAEQQPASGEAWRRLGNYCEKIDLAAEAESAWRRAVEVDEGEGEAAFSLATLLAGRGDVAGALHYIDASLKRLPRRAKLSPGQRRTFLRAVLEMLREFLTLSKHELALMVALDSGGAGDERVVTLSSIALRRIRSWDRLLDLLAGGTTFAASLVTELPEEETILERLLSAPPRSTPIAKGPASVGRKRKRARR